MPINIRKEGKRKEYFMIDPNLLKIEEGFNVRIRTQELEDHINSLAESIRDQGVLEPLVVRKVGDDYLVTNGHCRFEALSKLKAEGLEIMAPVIVEDQKVVSEGDRVAALVTRNSGLPLTIPEQATVVQRLLKYGWDQDKISKAFGKSKSHIINLEKYLSAPEEVKTLVNEGKVTPSTAINTLYSEGENAGEVLKEAVKTANQEGKKTATKKHIVKAKGPIVKKVTIKKSPTTGLFDNLIKYCENIFSDNEELANYLADTIETMKEKIETYEESKKEVVDNDED